MIGANKFGIDVHTRHLLKFHLVYSSCNMFVGLWAHIVPLCHPPTLLWVPFVTLCATYLYTVVPCFCCPSFCLCR